MGWCRNNGKRSLREKLHSNTKLIAIVWNDSLTKKCFWRKISLWCRQTDLLLRAYPQQNSLLFVKTYQLMSSLLQLLWHVSCTRCWRWLELLQELYSTKRSSPWDDAGLSGKFIFWWIWFRWLRLEVGEGLTLFLAKSAEASAPAQGTLPRFTMWPLDEIHNLPIERPKF